MVCRECGAEVGPEHVDGAKRLARCPGCGAFIRVSRERLKLMEGTGGVVTRVTPPSCPLCEDRGFLLLELQKDDHRYTYVFKCVCERGREEKRAWPQLPARLAAHLLEKRSKEIDLGDVPGF
ncbi:hypothetical protein [Ammonifex thiophilus]|uniref:Uncharacterized protein n=1 Tax=Ammonifex thiophilus TaxID=444093 RepID=A0A3D8P449_9THEO|nr:hypothetical protein [Ammonifex thiophilus]RDV83895.1 hypothetical protein DXX99_03410 [Ammonifex thiophilus]